jgi:hypothetical protein
MNAASKKNHTGVFYKFEVIVFHKEFRNKTKNVMQLYRHALKIGKPSTYST